MDDHRGETGLQAVFSRDGDLFVARVGALATPRAFSTASFSPMALDVHFQDREMHYGITGSVPP
jgi:hypothetical protein